MAWRKNDPNMTNDPRYLEPRITGLTAQLADTVTKVEAIDRGYGGTYATLTELQSAYPTGDAKRYVISADGNWYHWNETAWVSGGVFQGIGLSDGIVTPSKIANTGQKRFKGIQYPLTNIDLSIVPEDLFDNFILSGLLDIKIFNAEKDKQYRFRYITKNQTTFGNLILIDVFDQTGTKVRDLFNTVRRDYVINSNGLTTLTLDADNGQEIVVLTVDYSTIANNSTLDFTNAYYKCDLNRISPDRYFYQKASKADAVIYNNLVEFSATSNFAYVYSKYNSLTDIKFTFDKFSINKLFGMRYVLKKAASGYNPAKFSSGHTWMASADSDWVSPYIVKAVNNSDGSSRQYTGGAHSSDNNATTGNPTGVTESYEVYVDGVKLTVNGDYYGNEIDIYVRNRIMAYNTRTVGRYVLMERVHYKIRGTEIKVDVDIMPLEDIVLEEYYGQQAQTFYYDSVFYPVGQHLTGQPLTTNNDSGVKQNYFVDSFICTKGTEKLIVEHDNTKNLGRRRFLPLDKPCAFTRSYGKTYMQLAYGNQIVSPTNDLLQWSGRYIFKG